MLILVFTGLARLAVLCNPWGLDLIKYMASSTNLYAYQALIQKCCTCPMSCHGYYAFSTLALSPLLDIFTAEAVLAEC